MTERPLDPAAVPSGPSVTTATVRPRREYLDWMRGLAVLIMIEAHLFDSWTRSPDRESREFGWAMILGGFGAPLFLFLAGTAVALSAGSKLRRTGDVRLASRLVVRRGLEIFALAFLFRLQAWALGWSSPRALLKVDILNIMGPSIVAAAVLWGVVHTARARVTAFVATTLALTLLTPIVRVWEPLSALPDPIEAYVRPIPGLTSFVFFPWAGFLFAGVVLGLLLDPVRSLERERTLNQRIAVAAASLAVLAFACSYLPSPYASSYFWTTSPAFFLLRTGVMLLAVSMAFFWVAGRAAPPHWSPVAQMGRTSLFIYWIHVEMVYGLISRPLHKALSLQQAFVAFALFAGFMLACALAKERVVRWWQISRRRAPLAEPVS